MLIDSPPLIIASALKFGAKPPTKPITIIYLKLGKTIDLHGRGEGRRAFIHARDVAELTSKVILNGTDLGIYALEEHFERRLLENNQRKAGVIVRFDEEKMWDENVQFGKWMFGEAQAKISGYGSYFYSEIDAFQTNKIHSNSVYLEQ